MKGEDSGRSLVRKGAAVVEAKEEFSRGLENVIAARSTLCYIDGFAGKLLYLGIPIEELADKSSFEEVCFLLWHRWLPRKEELKALDQEFRRNRTLPEDVLRFIRLIPKSSHPMEVLRTIVSLLACFDPELDDTSKEATLRKTLRVTAQMPTIVAAFHRIREGKKPVEPHPDLNHAGNFLYMLFGEVPDDFSARVMDVALILHADHELNASAFATLVTASTLSDIYSSVTTGIGALKGPLHGGANEAVLKMLQEIGVYENIEPYIQNAVMGKKKVAGFGHRVYRIYDPRARIFKEYARLLSEKKGDTTLYEMNVKIEELMIQAFGGKGIYPNIDFYSGIVYHQLGIPADLFTSMFAISRVAGWTAHVLEYWEDNRIFRPRALYVGPMEQKYIPLEER